MSNTLHGLGLRKLFSNFAGTLGRQLLAAFIQLVVVAIIARVYGPQGNGIYGVSLLLPTFLSIFMNLGLGPANVYYLGTGNVNTKTAFFNTLIFSLFISILGLAAGSLVIVFAGQTFFPGIPKPILWISLVTFPFILLQDYLASIFQGKQQFKEYNVILLLRPFIILLLLGVLILLGSDNIIFVIVSNSISYVLTVFVAVILVYKEAKQFEYEKELNYYKKSFVYGFKSHLSNVLSFINYRVDIFIVNLLLNPAAAGVYIICVQLSEKLWLLSKSISTVLLPRLSELSKEEDKRLQITPLISRIVFFVTGIGVLGIAAIAYPVIVIVFGNDYKEAFIPLLLLLPGITAGSTSRVLANDIAARNKPELNMYVSFFVVFANVFLNILLIPLMGINGAALATTGVYCLTLAARTVIYVRITKHKVSSLYAISVSELSGLIKNIKNRESIQQIEKRSGK